jgi:hypothetical protein
MTLAQEILIGARLVALRRLAHDTSVAYAALEAELLERLRDDNGGSKEPTRPGYRPLVP